MGLHTFAAGEVLTASNVMTYLMNQAVIDCTSGTRPSTPQVGMTIYETDNLVHRAWNGSAWVQVPSLTTAGTLDVSGSGTGGGLQIKEAAAGVRVPAGRILYPDASNVYVGDVDGAGRGVILRQGGNDRIVVANEIHIISSPTYIGLAANGGTGNRLKVDANNSGWVDLVAEDQGAGKVDLYLDANDVYVRDASLTQLLKLSHQSSLSNDMTAMTLTYIDHAGTTQNARIYSLTAGNMIGGEHYLVAYLGS